MVRALTLACTALGTLALVACSALDGRAEPPVAAPRLPPAPTPIFKPERPADPRRTLPRDSGTPVAYVALGDSTVEGIGASGPEKHYVGRIFERLAGRYPAATLANLGVAGATSADVARGQLPKAVALQPTLVTLSDGPNDVTQGRSIDEYERNIDQILRTLTRETEAVVVVNTLPDLAVSPIFADEEKLIIGELVGAFNDVLARTGPRYGAEVVDLHAPSQVEVPADTSLFSPDNYHPSDAGYARWADHVWRGVERRVEGSS